MNPTSTKGYMNHFFNFDFSVSSKTLLKENSKFNFPFAFHTMSSVPKGSRRHVLYIMLIELVNQPINSNTLNEKLFFNLIMLKN